MSVWESNSASNFFPSHVNPSRISPGKRGTTRPIAAETLTRAIAGEPKAQEEVLEITFDFVRRMLVRLLGKSPDVDDLQQNVMMAILVHLPEYRLEASFTTWVGAICINQVRAHARRRKVRSIVVSSDDMQRASGEFEGVTQGDPQTVLAARDLLRRCEDVIGRLTVEQRIAFLLKIEGYSVEEVAVITQSAVSTTRMRLYASRRHIAKALAALPDKPDDSEGES